MCSTTSVIYIHFLDMECLDIDANKFVNFKLDGLHTIQVWNDLSVLPWEEKQCELPDPLWLHLQNQAEPLLFLNIYLSTRFIKIAR